MTEEDSIVHEFTEPICMYISSNIISKSISKGISPQVNYRVDYKNKRYKIVNIILSEKYILYILIKLNIEINTNTIFK